METRAAASGRVAAVELAAEERARASPRAAVERLARRELEALAQERRARLSRVARGVAAGQPEADVAVDGRGDEDSEASDAAADLVNDDDCDSDDDATSGEALESTKTPTAGRRDEEAKALRRESQKPSIDRQRATRGSREALARERGASLRERRRQRSGDSSSASGAVDRRARSLTLAAAQEFTPSPSSLSADAHLPTACAAATLCSAGG